VTDRQILMAGGVVGALVGVIGSYLYFTESGRGLREQVESNFGSFAQEAERLLSAADQVRQSVAEIRGRQGFPRSA
jgi:gas vesicle protein